MIREEKGEFPSFTTEEHLTWYLYKLYFSVLQRDALTHETFTKLHPKNTLFIVKYNLSKTVDSSEVAKMLN